MGHTINLIVFGDSWVTGEGLGQQSGKCSPYAFGSQLSSMMNASKFTNCGIAGSSNSRTVLELLKYVETQQNLEDHIAIFFITAPERTCFISSDSRGIVDLHSGIDTKEARCHVNYFSGILQLRFECFKNIVAMQQICQQYKIKDYYIIGWSDNVDLNFPGINREKVYPHTCIQLFGYKDQDDFISSEGNQYTLGKQQHPSVLGHSLIAQTLCNWISNETTTN